MRPRGLLAGPQCADAARRRGVSRCLRAAAGEGADGGLGTPAGAALRPPDSIPACETLEYSSRTRAGWHPRVVTKLSLTWFSA
jgi:hypothetical protein